MDRRPDLVAALDQARAAIADVARIIAEYRRQLIAAGVTADDALELCIELQREIIFSETE